MSNDSGVPDARPQAGGSTASDSPTGRRREEALPAPEPLPTEGALPDGPLPPSQPNAFGSGPLNAIALGLVHRRDGDVVRTALTLDARYEGARGVAHGGIVSTLLDDVMGGVLQVMRVRSVTAQLDVSFVAPVVVDRELTLEAWLEGVEGRKLRLVGVVREGSRTLAIGRGLFIAVGPEHFERIGAPVPELAPLTE